MRLPSAHREENLSQQRLTSPKLNLVNARGIYIHKVSLTADLFKLYLLSRMHFPLNYLDPMNFRSHTSPPPENISSRLGK